MSLEQPAARGLLIRAMTVQDVDRVIAIAAALPFAPAWPRTAYEAAILSEESPQRVALVAETHGEVAGFVIANLIAGEAEIESIAVAAAAQRRGIAMALLQALIAQFKGLGAESLELEVRESNVAAQRLYAQTGFREAGRRRGYYHAPAEDAVLLVLELLPEM